ncbi:DUF2461 domain-containing protein [Rhodocytophaga rosea]|uniref:DUF2461 domain-containing protein n=1 Tax=Rhodocytophaga rosea TaxID=2704465 RepID=A0A6C0GTJ0_9BACT|nr:DUF2461 domain-containing protein [Rhodocytophaga rosea]QHT71217.1 DUF2461 domain-containing protein [Rhodocytophaga rosea]
MQETLNFLTALKENNQREWLEAHKSTYESTRKDFSDFVSQVLKEIIVFEPTFAPLEPKDCIFRLYRDVRFSKDKTPYKTNYSAYFAEGGRKSTKAGYYLHIEPGNKSMLAGGIYMPMPEELKKIRQEIDYNGETFTTILSQPDFVKYFGKLSGSTLKTIPKGYAADHPSIELLKHKDFTVFHQLTDAEVVKPGLLQHISHVWKTLKPLNDFLNQAVE